MKIAFIVGEFPALSETFILNQIVGLIRLGHEVDIYATRPRSEPKVHPDVEKYDLLSRTYYAVEMPTNRLRRVLTSCGLVLTNFHKAPRVMLRTLNIFKHRQHFGSLTLLYEVIPWLQKGALYEIIHCHFGMNGLKATGLREIDAIGGKLITAYYGLDISQYLQEFGENIYCDLFDIGDLFFPISNLMKSQLIRMGCDRQKIVVHRLGIDSQRFFFTPRRLAADGVVRLITIARLVEKKGLEYSIRAVAQLASLNQKIEYNIIGDGCLKADLQHLIQELDAENINLLGWQQQEEVVALLNNSHILIAPSVTSQSGDQEGTPVVIMEAMAMGLPILSTLHSGIPELVEDGVSGFLVPERDVDALAEKLRYLIQNSARWEEMGKAGRACVENYYNIDKLNEQLVEIYQRLLL